LTDIEIFVMELTVFILKAFCIRLIIFLLPFLDFMSLEVVSEDIEGREIEEEVNVT